MSQKNFNDLEALRIAINIESRGERFYRAAAAKIQGNDVRNMLEKLADQEGEHANTFNDLYNKAIDDKLGFDDNYLFEPEVAAYFEAMVESSVFPNDKEQDRIIENINSVSDALKLGVQAEKDSILFYTEMIIYSKYTEAKNMFRKLLSEEKSHLVDLQQKLKEYE